MDKNQNKILQSLENKNISTSTLNLYIKNLKRLNDGNEIKNLNFLKDSEKVLDKIKHLKPNTRKTYIISIVSLLKQDAKQKKLYDKYFTILMDYNKDLKNNTTKSETQVENWISQDDVKDIQQKIEDDIKPKLINKKLTDSEFSQLLNLMVLSLYTLNPPRRNLDYQYAVVVKKYNDSMDDKYNYVDLEKNEFHFNNFKTKKTYQRQTVPINEDLRKIIDEYLKFHPLIKNLKKKDGIIPFLVNAKGDPFESTNTITRILNKIFGKKIGSSMLRNIYLTSKYGNENKEKQEDALKMGTSTTTADQNYIKLD